MQYVYVCLNLIVFGISVVSTAHVNTNHSNKTKSHLRNNVLLISFDGFRWDYFDLVNTPVLNSFKKHGVHAKYVKNVIPTSTFPNHVSLATGLYPESHGIVSNEMYDPTFNSTFTMPVTDPKWWWSPSVEPIWFTNEKQGGVSGVCYWPGYNIDGYRPTFNPDREGKYSIPYHTEEHIMPYKERVDTVMEWLREDDPPNFMMLYFGQLDEVSHKYGYGSDAALKEVSRLDNITGYLLHKLSENNLLDQWNIIITGDHGMTNLSLDRVITIKEDFCNCQFLGGGVTSVWPKKGKTMEVYEKLKNFHPNMKVYLKEDIPTEFHYHKNVRIAPIVVMVDEGWRLNTTDRPVNLSRPLRGSHGFSNTYPSMWPLFLARGPAFKKGYLLSPFESVNIYSLMCEILGIQPKPNNGSLNNVKSLLVSDPRLVSAQLSPVMIGFGVSFLFMVLGTSIFAVAMCCSQKNVRKSRKQPWRTKVRMSELEQTNSPLLNDYDDNENVATASTSSSDDDDEGHQNERGTHLPL